MSAKQTSIKSAIIAEIERFAAEGDKELPPLTEDLPLLDLAGLDSLALAILVARLETELGLDPFTGSDDIFYPVTLGDFIRAYEKADETR
jgi:acyl carrier protein